MVVNSVRDADNFLMIHVKCLRFCLYLVSYFSKIMTDEFAGKMNQLYLTLNTADCKDMICDKIRNVFASGAIVDDLFLSLNESDLDKVNVEIMNLYQQRQIQRHHIQFSENLKLDLQDIPKYYSILRLSGCSVIINESKNVVKFFSFLHTMENLHTVKLTTHFIKAENIDDFYERTLPEFPTNSVQQLSIDKFLRIYNIKI